MAWERGTEVRRLDNPGKIGTTTGQVRERSSGPCVQVRWNDGTADYVAADQIELADSLAQSDPYALIAGGRYGRAADLRRNLTQAHLSGRLANLVYAMGITNTDFYAHQYRPLLTLLDSPADGLLIADEVGLGKTVEAGLIWTELRAREDMRRLLVVCPAMLVDKWRDDLRHRFGIDALAVNAKTLAEELRSASPFSPPKAWVASYHSLRPAKSWRPGSPTAGKRGPSYRQQLADFLAESEDADPVVDMVVFDEAHYMRNPESAANRLGSLLRAVSHYRVLLSATPINLHNEDLFELLKLCDPEHFQFQSSFHQLLQANAPLVRARDAALRRDSTAADIVSHLQAAAETPLLSGSRQLQALLQDPPTDVGLTEPSVRAELAASLERINLLGHVLTRTRKRDVQIHRPVREVRRESVPMTDAERKFYEFVTEATRDYAFRRGISDGFLLATPQRQVCSCPAAFARGWLGDDAALLEDLTESAVDEAEAAEEDVETDEISASLRDFLLACRPRNLDVASLEREDSKLARLVEVAQDYVRQHPGEKLVVFTSFRGTAQYLQRRLGERGIGAMLIWGNMHQSKQEVINDFAARSDVSALISTEVASEGVDLQFCRLLVNYDLPWNPMRVEQRIGRIDRLGQSADRIHIWNLFYRETIDERILGRLLERLQIFTSSLGEPEPIVGETIQRLEADLLTAKLSPQQEDDRIAQAALVLENVRQRQEELERNAAQMMAHGGLMLERINAAQELSKRVTEEDLLIFVRDYLTRHAPGHQLQQEGDRFSFSIQLPPDVAARFEDFSRKQGMVGLTQLATGTVRACRFVNKIAGVRDRHVENIHQFHPLIRFIGAELATKGESHFPVIAASVSAEAAVGITPGCYVFSLRKWVFDGVKPEEVLAAAAIELESGASLSSDASEQLVNAARLSGSDWLDASHDLAAERVSERLDALEDALEDRYRASIRRKQDENSDRAMFQLHGVDQHLANRMSTLEQVRRAHEALRRTGLARATQGRIDKLRARMQTRREQILQRQQMTPETLPLCCGVILVREA